MFGAQTEKKNHDIVLQLNSYLKALNTLCYIFKMLKGLLVNFTTEWQQDQLRKRNI